MTSPTPDSLKDLVDQAAPGLDAVHEVIKEAGGLDAILHPAEEPAPEEPDVEFEWQPVFKWPAEVTTLMEDIDDIERVLSRLKRDGKHASTDPLYTKVVDLLEQAVMGNRLELCAKVLEIHGLEQP